MQGTNGTPNSPTTYVSTYAAQKSPMLAIFFAACLVIGAVFFYQEWGKQSSADESQNWNVAQGTILQSNVARHRSSKGTWTYALQLEYTYQTGGKNYTSDRISFGEISLGDRGAVEKRAAEYPVGRQVDVYFNPNDPYQAVLEPGVGSGNVMGLAVGALFSLVGFIGLIWHFKK